MTLKMIVARITKLMRVTLPGLRSHSGLRPPPRSRPSPSAALPRWTQDRDRVRRRRRGGVQLCLRFFITCHVASSIFVPLVIKVASNFFFFLVLLLLANVASSFFVPLAINVASNLFSIFFHYSPRWRPPRSRTRPPFPRSLRWRRELAAKRIKPTRFELLGQSFLHTLSLLEPGLPGLNILG